jgi:circadian clock protein KaiB
LTHRVIYKFRLYVAAHTPNSAQARANLSALCRSNLAGRHEIEVVNVFSEPERALEDGIRMTPTLIKLAPPPVRRIIGTLIETERVLQALDIDTTVT